MAILIGYATVHSKETRPFYPRFLGKGSATPDYLHVHGARISIKSVIFEIYIIISETVIGAIH